MTLRDSDLVSDPVESTTLGENLLADSFGGEIASPSLKVLHGTNIAPNGPTRNYDCYMDANRVLARNFGRWLKKKMDARDWNGADLAREINRAGGRARPSDVSRWVRGERRPRPDTLEFVADALGVTHAEAMEAAGHMPQLPMTHLERWHAALDPLLKKIPYDDEHVFSMRSEAERIIRIRELRAGKRTVDQLSDPVELDEDEEE